MTANSKSVKVLIILGLLMSTVAIDDMNNGTAINDILNDVFIESSDILYYSSCAYLVVVGLVGIGLNTNALAKLIQVSKVSKVIF